jgi:hypothetical protein
VRVCLEEEKVCRHDSSVQNYCLLGQRRRHDNKPVWHDPAVVDALPFKYTESIVSAASALNCAETALCYWTRTFIRAAHPTHTSLWLAKPPPTFRAIQNFILSFLLVRFVPCESLAYSLCPHDGPMGNEGLKCLTKLRLLLA